MQQQNAVLLAFMACRHTWVLFPSICGHKSIGIWSLHVSHLDGRICEEFFPNPMILKNRVGRGCWQQASLRIDSSQNGNNSGESVFDFIEWLTSVVSFLNRAVEESCGKRGSCECLSGTCQ